MRHETIAWTAVRAGLEEVVVLALRWERERSIAALPLGLTLGRDDGGVAPVVVHSHHTRLLRVGGALHSKKQLVAEFIERTSVFYLDGLGDVHNGVLSGKHLASAGQGVVPVFQRPRPLRAIVKYVMRLLEERRR